MYDHILLSETRDSMGVSNRDIANGTNLSESTVSRIMTGTSKDPTFDSIADICAFLHIPLDAVAGRNALDDVPQYAGASVAEALLVVRDFTKRNVDRVRAIEHEKDVAYNRHIDHLKEMVDKFSNQIRRQWYTILSLIALAVLLLGVIVSLRVVNINIQQDLQEYVAEFSGQPEQ